MKVLFTIILVTSSIICFGQIDQWDSVKVDATLYEAGQLEFSDRDSSMALTSLAIEKANAINYRKGYALAILQKGYLLEDIGDYKEAVKLYDSSIVIFKKLNGSAGIAKASNALGVLLNYQGKYDEAIKSLQVAYNAYEKTKNLNGKAMALGNMGLVQTNIQNYDKALNYYKQSLELKVSLNDSLGIAIDHMNIGNAYSLKEDFETALDHLYQSIEMSNLIDDKIGISYCLTSIGEVFIKQEKYVLAEENFIYAMEIQKSISDKKALASSYRSLGTIYLILKRTPEAIEVLEKGMLIANELELTPIKIDLYDILSEVYEIEGNLELALKFERNFSKLKDSIHLAEKKQELSDIDSKYHTKLKDEEISTQEAELTEKDKEIDTIIEEENFIMILSSGIILTVLCFAGLVFFNFRKKKKLANELEKLSIVAREIENTVIIADAKGEIEWINESYSRKAGYELKEFKQKFGKYIANASDSPEIHDVIAKCKRDKKPAKYVLHMAKKSGEMHWIQTTINPIVNKKGEIEKFILIDADITEIKDAEAKMVIQRDELALKNNLITESIDYAKRIQSALLPSQENLSSSFKDYFIFYKPKDIVSGDFYWLNKKENKTFFAVADCTGHGVPGALISIIGMNELNNIIDNSETEPNSILEGLSGRIQKKLAHNDHKEQLKDGIDISLCSFEETSNENQIGVLKYAGAHNTLYLVRDNQLSEHKGNRIHIGANRRAENTFTQESIPIQKGDIIYLFSDGFVDQKGGSNNKKFYYGPFRELLLSIQMKSMKEQNEILSNKISDWKGSSEQLDDMLIWGIRF